MDRNQHPVHQLHPRA